MPFNFGGSGLVGMSQRLGEMKAGQGSSDTPESAPGASNQKKNLFSGLVQRSNERKAVAAVPQTVAPTPFAAPAASQMGESNAPGGFVSGPAEQPVQRGNQSANLGDGNGEIPGLSNAVANQNRVLDRRDRNDRTVGQASRNQQSMSDDAQGRINASTRGSMGNRSGPTSTGRSGRPDRGRRRGVVTVEDI